MKPRKSGEYPRLEIRKVSELAPAGENPRRITAEQKGKLKRSLDELGNLSPVTFNVRTGKVLGGHKRIEVLIEAGTESTAVWCVRQQREALEIMGIDFDIPGAIAGQLGDMAYWGLGDPIHTSG